jgi:hypothetical protein
MATVLTNTDVLIYIYESVGVATDIGFNSEFADKVHPGSNKQIKGWEWDRRTWTGEFETRQNFYLPFNYDFNILRIRFKSPNQ